MFILNYFFSLTNRYFSSLFLTWISIVLGVFSFIVTITEIAENNRRAMNSVGGKGWGALELSLIRLPDSIQLLLPFIILIATVITLWRLNKSNEIIVTRSFGVSIWQVIGGFSFVVLVIAILNVIVINPIATLCSLKQQQLENRLFKSGDLQLKVVENGLLLRENFKGRHSIIQIKGINTKSQVFSGITIQNTNDENEFSARIDAKQARIDDGFWKLSSVSVYRANMEKQTLATLEIPTDLKFKQILNSNKDPKGLLFWQLPAYIDLLDRSGLSSISHRMYWHSLFSKGGMMIAMIFLGAAFCLRPIRRGYVTLLSILAVTSGLVIHTVNDLIYAMGLSERLPILLAAWGPVFVVFLLSVTLILHQEEG